VLGHAMRAGLLSHPEDVTMQLDFRSAFNSLSREAMLKAVAHRAPQLFKFADWMYKQPSPLRLAEAPPETAPLWSESGVRQGDPCRPLLFALAIPPVLESVPWHPSVRLIAVAWMMSSCRAQRRQFRKRTWICEIWQKALDSATHQKHRVLPSPEPGFDSLK
jgi:hypothetical protein